MKLSKWALIAFLCFLPFQWQFSNLLLSYELGTSALVVKALDELFVIGLILPLLCIRLLKIPTISLPEIVLLVPFLLIGFWDLTAALANVNSVLVSLAGTLSHLRNFLIIFFFSSINWSSDEIYKAYNTLKRVAIFLAVVAIIQEIWMLLTNYIFSNPLLFWPSALHEWRAGFYRTPSLVGHPNILGIFLLLFFSVELRLTKGNLGIGLVASAILCTLSRIIYLAFLVLTLLSFKGRRGLIVAMLLSVLFITRATPSSIKELGFGISREVQGEQLLQISYFRGYTIEKSLEIWKDQPIFGTGPGMYGDVVSFFIDSPIYEKYNFDPIYLEFARVGKGLDQFYPVIMAESGLPSLFLFLLFFSGLSISARMIVSRVDNSFEKKLANGLIYIPIALSIVLMANSINMTFFLFPYFALLGMLMSRVRNFEKRGAVTI